MERREALKGRSNRGFWMGPLALALGLMDTDVQNDEWQKKNIALDRDSVSWIESM